MSRVIAIDGYGGPGKTTFATLLGNELGVKVIHTDDFASDDNPIDWWPEVIEKVLKPTKKDGFKKGYIILEGVSSLRKEFGQFVDFGIFVDTPIDVCRERMHNREEVDENINVKFEKWLAAEIHYMKRDNPKKFADVLIDGTVDFIKQVTETKNKILSI